MPLNQDMLIDLALNVAGYLAAGALSMVIYSMFRRAPRPSAPTPAGAHEATPVGNATAVTSASRRSDDVQFVGFGDRTSAGESGGSSLTLRRNRAEVLRLARGMLRSGASDVEIKAVLPVSDAELAVLNYERS